MLRKVIEIVIVVQKPIAFLNTGCCNQRVNSIADRDAKAAQRAVISRRGDGQSGTASFKDHE